ncbi:hypothetical protein OROHE_021662 [Orobanche hederae]
MMSRRRTRRRAYGKSHPSSPATLQLRHSNQSIYTWGIQKIPVSNHPAQIKIAMARSGVKLPGSRYSPFVNRVVMALEMKSIEYEIVEMSPYEKPELLVKNNPIHKKVLVLIHGDDPICESLIILQYIDDAWTNGPSLLPLDPYERSIARFWAAFLDDKLAPLLKEVNMVEGEEAKKPVLEKIFEALLFMEEALIKCSKGKAFFGGEDVGYIDIALGSHVGWIRVYETLIGTKIFDESKTPFLVRWAERLYSDSLVKDVMLEPQMLLELLKKFQAMTEAASD